MAEHTLALVQLVVDGFLAACPHHCLHDPLPLPGIRVGFVTVKAVVLQIEQGFTITEAPQVIHR